jgi:uncharacterized protein (TIGR02246 family)
VGVAIIALAALAASPATDGAIRQVETAQERAWNAHDATSYAALFTTDATVVNVLGWTWRGRDEIARKLTRAFGFTFARSRLRIETVRVRRLSPGYAAAEVSWSMTGARSPDGVGHHLPQRGTQLQLLTNTPRGWRILAFQNTLSTPERPFPVPAG